MDMNNIKVGAIVEAEITGMTKYGIFVRLEDNYNGLIHISEISDGFVEDISKLYSIGNIIKVKILDVDEDKLHVKLSMKKANYILKKRNRRIFEKGSGFDLLKESLPMWVEAKISEIKKSENK